MVLSTKPPRPSRPSPSDSPGPAVCWDGAGLCGSEGTLVPPTLEKGWWSTTGCCGCSLLAAETYETTSGSLADPGSWSGRGVTGDPPCEPLISRDRGMTRGQQGTSSAIETGHVTLGICWAAWIGEMEPKGDPCDSSTGNDVCGDDGGKVCALTGWAWCTKLPAGSADDTDWSVGGADTGGDRVAKRRGSVLDMIGGLQNPYTS